MIEHSEHLGGMYGTEPVVDRDKFIPDTAQFNDGMCSSRSYLTELVSDERTAVIMRLRRMIGKPEEAACELVLTRRDLSDLLFLITGE